MEGSTRAGDLTDVSELKKQLEALRLDEQDARSSRRKWIVLVVALLLAAAGFAAWRGRTSVPEVDMVRATLRQGGPVAGTPMLTASGYVVARRKAVVSAKIQGRLSELRVEEGSRAAEGEVIARLESADYEAQVARARARIDSVRALIGSAEARVARAEADLAEARRQLGVAEKLVSEGIGTVDARDAARSRVALADASLGQARADQGQAQSELGQAQADLSFAQAQLANTIIRAPFAGTVVRKMAEVGESVAPIPPGVNISTASGAIVALADLDTLEVEVDVSESNVAKLGADQPAEVVVEAFPDRKYRGALRQVIPTADRTKATVMVKVTILDKDRDLKPEMSARVTFFEPNGGTSEAANTPVVLVPQQAIVTRNGTSEVFEITADGTVRERKVTLGAVQQSQIVVKEGLTGQETLVAGPPDTMKDGDRVRMKDGR